MRPLIHRFSNTWLTDMGHKVRVEMQDAPDVSQEADFRPRRIAVVTKSPLTYPGTVISGHGTAYLLIGQVTLAGLDRFRALEITSRLPWVRKGKMVDPVTGFEVEAPPTTLDYALPCVVEPLRVIKDLGIERPKLAILTGADVKIGDRLGGYLVNSVMPHLGVKMLEVY